MNRKLYIFVMAIFAIVYVIFANLPYYNDYYFYTQHISLFLFASMFILFILKLIFNKVESKITKGKNVLKVFTVVIFGVMLYSFSFFQSFIIDAYQTPAHIACVHYDRYGHALYYTQLPNSCPELDISINTATEFKFSVTVSQSGIVQEDMMGIVEEDGYNFQGHRLTDIHITYDNQGRILTADIKVSTNILLENETTVLRKYNSVSLQMINEYTVDSFTSTQVKKLTGDIDGDFTDVENVVHSDFTGHDSYEYVYNSNILYVENDITTIGFSTKVSKNDEVIEDYNYYGVLIDNKLSTRIDKNEGSYDVVYSFGEDSLTIKNVINEYWQNTNYEFEELDGIGLVLRSLESDVQLGNTEYEKYSYISKFNGNYIVEFNDYYNTYIETEYGLMLKRQGPMSDGETSKDDEDRLYGVLFLSSIYTWDTEYGLSNTFNYERSLFYTNYYATQIYEENPLISDYID